VGLVGFPNAGKTSLLNEITRSKGKVGAYPFTTLEPALGEMFGFILADIPGLIEGAAQGKGLGHKFLRHIRRTKVLVHLVSLENENPVEAYQAIRKELGQFDKELLNKKEIVVLTKADLINDGDKIEAIVNNLKKAAPPQSSVTTVSVYDDASLKNLQELMMKEAGIAKY
jgi:GTP-binding protein